MVNQQSSSFHSEDYGIYLDQEFRYRWLKPEYLYHKLEKFRHHSNLQINEAGRSEEDRPIYKISYGHGKKKILLWSQMHGNEPTATMAFIDIFNFLTANDNYNALREKLAKELQLIFIPMLNPDGAERFSRRNALGIDLNRDAITESCAEMKVFKEIFVKIKPDFAFNMHDQRNFFSAGSGPFPATISFLAPSADEERQVTPSRRKSIQLIVEMYKEMQQHYPNYCGRFTDEFYPRALGDFCQVMKVSSILIESGGFPDDPYRDIARQLNFLLLMHAFESVADQSYLKNTIHPYLNIPKNETVMMDIIIRDCKLHYPHKTITTDLGLMMEEKKAEDGTEVEQVYILKDIGDLRFNYGYREYNGGEIHSWQSPAIEKKCNFRIELPRKFLIFENGEFDEEYKSL